MKVEDLTNKEKEQLAHARAMVDQQQAALDELRPAMDALIEAGSQDKLAPKHRRTIATIMRWDEADYEEFFNPPEIEGVEPLSVEDRVRRTFATPMAYFYISRGKQQVQVYVEHGKQTQIRDEDHPEFF